MNKHQKLVQADFLGKEETIIKRLKQVYNQALKDIEAESKTLSDQINVLKGNISASNNPEEQAVLQSMMQSKVYQKQYQDALKKQVGSILDKMQVEEFKSVSEYLVQCYENGFLGTLYDLHGQGIPLVFPMDQEAVVRAVQLDSKIKQGLYTRLGEDVSVLKKKISAEVSRGIATGRNWGETARDLAGYTNIGFNNAVRITRTEGHRIQCQSAMDACEDAKGRGADIVKQWDAALDGRTRPTHQKVDGEIRELDEKFSNDLNFPGDPNGKAAEVVNCRCALLQRARWALDEEELETLKERAEFFGLDKTANFEDFKKKYLKAAQEIKAQDSRLQFIPAKTIEEATQYADRFVNKYKSSLTGIVDYSGIQLQFANEMNRAFTEVFDNYDVPYPLRNIKPFNTREKRFKGTTAEAAYNWGVNDLFYNKSYYKTQKAFNDHLTEYNNLIKTVLPNIDAAIAKTKPGASLRYLEALKRTGRTNIFAPDAYGSTIHEMGHYLDDQIFRKAFKEKGFDLSASFEKYSDGISGYATATQQEYIAESFAAYWTGEIDILDPELVKIFEGAKKK